MILTLVLIIHNVMLTLTAMAQGLGGNPFGPAGTGKTETVKALGQQLGRLVLVFNCDEAIDVKAMTRILVGLIKCGAWGCFDEFNRLSTSVLSALSEQIHSIQVALKDKADSVTLPEFGEVEINKNSAIFITLNPMGDQYKGRNQLPNHLTALFSPIEMNVPDNGIIARVLLLSEGFSPDSSEELGNKIVSWFEEAKKTMSLQKHYDWGLRAIKSCLNSSGRILRSSMSSESNGRQSITREVQVVVQSLRQQIKSKLVEEDEVIFDDLILKIFKMRDDGSISDPQMLKLQEILLTGMEKASLTHDPYEVQKALELDEQLKSRLGVVILGESGVGKTTIWQMLMRAKREAEGRIIHPIVIAPKAIPRSQLLGFIDEETREWNDGIFPQKSREIARDEGSDRYWIILDGDIDPEWVEALNSVLDDNQVLTLPSGERIDFDRNRVNIIFEVTSLSLASPATISRLGKNKHVFFCTKSGSFPMITLCLCCHEISFSVVLLEMIS
jgi:dynein heavy chain 2